MTKELSEDELYCGWEYIGSRNRLEVALALDGRVDVVFDLDDMGVVV